MIDITSLPFECDLKPRPLVSTQEIYQVTKMHVKYMNITFIGFLRKSDYTAKAMFTTLPSFMTIRSNINQVKS